jgi:hypothetical protein
MTTLPARTWIGNAAAVLCRPWGAVTQQTRGAGCSRQAAYDHARRVQQAVADAQAGGPSRARLRADNDRLRQENHQLWQAWADSVSFGDGPQRRFTATAAALGLSLNQTRALLRCVLADGACPSRATLGRWVADAAGRAGRVLATLDRACQPLVTALCLDEIFCRRVPVLMGVEPHSLAWVLGQRGPDRSGPTWHRAVQAWPCLAYVAADNGAGLHLGLEGLRHDRRQAGRGPGLDVTLDVFHTRREGGWAVRGAWSAAERVWEEAEAADRDLARTRRRGQDGRGGTHRARLAWGRAASALAAACRHEAAWQRAARALEVFRPDGRLNDRAWAEAQIRAALPDLDGPRWAKVRRMLSDPRGLTFLDRLQRDLEAAEPRAGLREALVALWRQRHATRPGCGPGPGGAAAGALAAVRALVCGRLEPDWHGPYRRVARVLERVVRASSVVECLNGVVRMHQARHRGLSQPLLDLKRLYWNCREFAEGKREGQCPYRHLGLRLPTYDWWDLLNLPSAELEQKVSSQPTAA